MTTEDSAERAPQRTLTTLDAIGIIVGMIVGAGIFRLPSPVAAFSANETVYYGVWLAGGVVSLIGALCYAELASAYSNAGGDYYFLQRAFGRRLSFLYAWARIAVITTGAIGVLSYTFGDYASNLLRLGEHSSAIWAAIVVIVFTAINLAGIRESANTQNVLTAVELLGVIAVIVVGIFLVTHSAPAVVAAPAADAKPWTAGVPMAMLFVLFTYGGWNEAAYISAELKKKHHAMVRALAVSLAIVTVLYLAINYAYVHSLGLGGVAKSETVAADVLNLVYGAAGAKFISLLVAIATITSINATIIVGARSSYALGRDWPLFGWLGHWHAATDEPRNALIAQGVLALVLIGLGALTRQGFQTMVDYTMPVFWFFIMLVGIGLFVLRYRDRETPRPFKVPLYPLTPILFVATCAYLLYSSVAYAALGSIAGIIVLVVGAVILVVGTRLSPIKRGS